ncbi:MAG: prolyl oligopeptidase family serine peptidase [Nibricoccus sp.]
MISRIRNRLVTAVAAATILSTSAAEPPTSSRATPAAQRERFYELFQPLRSTHAALSPDGKYLAYSLHKDKKLYVATVDLDRPGQFKALVNLGEDRTPMLSSNEENTPVEAEWMQWVTPSRLVIATNSISAAPTSGGGWNSIQGAIFGVDADGSNYKLLASPRDLTVETLDIANGQNYGDFHRFLPSPEFPFRGIPPFTGPNSNHLPSRGIHPFSNRRMSPHVFDLSADPGKIIIQGRLGTQYRLYSLAVATGKIKLLDDDTAQSGMVPLFDRQGKLRGGIYHTNNYNPPFDYLLAKDTPLALGRWRAIDKIAKTSYNLQFSVSPDNFLGERSIPIGFDENPNILYFASNVGRKTYGLYSLNVKTGELTGFKYEDPAFDVIPFPRHDFSLKSILVFDRYTRQLAGIRYTTNRQTTHWFRPEIQTVQTELETSFPGKNVEIQGWDQTASRFLILLHGVSDPGSFLIYDTPKKRAYDIVRRAGWADDRPDHRNMTFTLPTKDGHTITGLLTFPNVARFENVPVIVQCPSEPWQRTSLSFKAETAAFAEMGFAVIQLDSAGAWGYGTPNRQAITGGYEQIIVNDITTCVTELAKKYRINPNRVGLFGEGYGGYVALRALQLHSDKFRCAAVIDAPVDIGSWLENDRWTRRSTTLELTRSYYGTKQLLREAALVNNPSKITKPVCMLIYPGPDGGPRTQIYLEARQFAAALRRQGTPVDLNELDKDVVYDTETPQTASGRKSAVVELDREFAQRLPHAQAAAYRRLEYFFNAYIYDYQVKLGPLKTLPDVEN